MSTATEISRLQAARNTIRNKLITFGLATSTDKLDSLASTIDGISNQGAISASVQEGDTYTIPQGYHNGSGTVSGIAGGGNYQLQAKGPITPTKNQINVSPDNGYYGLSAVTVDAIPEAYQDVSAVTAEASQVLATKIFVTSDGTITTGTMPNNGAVSQTLTAASTSYTVPSGYHNGAGSVSIALESKSAMPSTSSQTIVPSTGSVLSAVTINAIPSAYQDVTGVTAVASHVLTGDVFVNASGSEVTGTMPNIGAASSVLDTSHTNYTIPSGYHNGSGVVSLVTETKSVTPTTSSQNITPTSGKVLSSVTVAAIPSQYQDVSNVDAAAGDVLSGKIIVDVTGAEITGTMANNGAISGSIDGLTTLSYTIPSGYHNGSGTVSLTSDIETALAAI